MCLIMISIMKDKLYPIIILLAFLLLPLQMQAEGAAIKLEFGGTSMTVELSQQPKIVNENGNIVLKTNSMSVMLALPCKVTPTDGSGTAIDKVTIRNNEDNAPINVFTLDGKKVATLKDRTDVISLTRGIYIINGKKVFIK